MDFAGNDLKSVIRRRKPLFFSLFLPILLSGTLLSILMPPVYRSQATILFDEKMQTGALSRRYGDVLPTDKVEVLTQKVLSRARLLEICDRYGLFKDEEGRLSPEDRAENLRKGLVIQPVGNAMGDASVRKPTPSSVAFSITFESGDPKTAQQVTDAIAGLYISENQKASEKQMSDSIVVLEREVAGLEASIKAGAARLSSFKSAHWGELPEYAKQNLQALERLDGEIDRQNAQIAALEQHKIYLEGQLALLDPTITVDIPPHVRPAADPADPTPKLNELRLKKIALESRVSSVHPDLKQVQRELDEMEKQAKAYTVGQREQIEARISQLERKAAGYGPAHPDNQRIRGEKEALLRELSHLSDQTGSDQTILEPQQRVQDNPAFINVKTQLAATEREIKGRLDEGERIKKKILEYEALLAKAPVVEREYIALMDEAEALKKRHAELTTKLQEARLSNNAEQTEQSERFTIIDPAGRPERPIRPNRAAILMLAAVLALGAGFGGVALRESTDLSIRSIDEFAQLGGVPVLGVFPVVTTREKKRRRGLKILALMLALGLCVGGSFSLFRKNPALYQGYFEQIRQYVYVPWGGR